ncbi:MAG: hypothetical protein R3A47_08990 [Polyangiales bacterium]
MDIHLSKSSMRQIQLAVDDAVENGDTDPLRDELMSAFSEDAIEEIERRIDTGDFYDFITEILEEWSGEDAEELLELLETQLADADVDLKYTAVSVDEEEEEEEEDEEESDDDDDLMIDDDY